MISPYLYDLWPFLLLIFSPLETADFLMLLMPPGDGYSLLCSKKQPPRQNWNSRRKPDFWLLHGISHFLAWQAGTNSPYSTGESPPIKAGHQETIPHLETTCECSTTGKPQLRPRQRRRNRSSGLLVFPVLSGPPPHPCAQGGREVEVCA